MIYSDKPYIFFEGQYSKKDILIFKKENQVDNVIDIYKLQCKEFFEVSHPDLLFKTDLFQKKLHSYVEHHKDGGNWIYFPWDHTLIHTVNQKQHHQLLTNRNRNLITDSEQAILKNFHISIIGLSVGSGIATTLAYSGISNHLTLAEFDTLETTNLNRIRSNLMHIGQSKINIVAQQIYEVNPYATLILIKNGITKKTLAHIFKQKQKIKLIFEIIDSFEMKIHLRSLARKYKIPLIMVTNIGDRIILDVERYDLKEIKFFNGRAGLIPDTILKSPDLTTTQKNVYAVSLANKKNIPARALQSVAQIGKTLVGRPQLASTVTIATGLCAYLARKIALGEKLPSASWLIDIDKFFKKEAAL